MPKKSYKKQDYKPKKNKINLKICIKVKIGTFIKNFKVLIMNILTNNESFI